VHISDPLPGNTHDAKVMYQTDLNELLGDDNAIGDRGHIGTGITTRTGTQRRPQAGVVMRAHKTLIRERTRHTQRLRYARRDYFPGRVGGLRGFRCRRCPGVAGRGTGPGLGGEADDHCDHRRTHAARRRNIAEKAARIQAVLRAEQLGQPEVPPQLTRPRPAAPRRCSELSMSRSRF
jgi:hypothetical protein